MERIEKERDDTYRLDYKLGMRVQNTVTNVESPPILLGIARHIKDIQNVCAIAVILTCFIGRWNVRKKIVVTCGSEVEDQMMRR